MAKQTRPKSHGFTIQGFDTEHYKQTDAYVKAIDDLYQTAVQEFASMCGSLSLDPSKPFSFSDYPQMERKAQAIVNGLASKMTAVIQHGTRDQWLYACKKNDEFLAHVMKTSKINKRALNRFQDRNLDALSAFQDRKVNGLDLSQRVWRYAGQIKGQMELGIDIAVGDGRSAADLSRDLRSYLREPDKLFRRVRDKHGNLHLSKNAAAYHPGQGVYRSSYLNALRLARTEINMSYRDSDRYRWSQMDFVVGFEVHLSNNHTTKGPDGKPRPFHDICDELAGRYPKDFVFKGWHPQCRCFVTPILMDPDEFNTDELNELKSAINGTEYQKYSSRNEITEVPGNFTQYVKDHQETFEGWKKPPYWIRDNYKGGQISQGLRLKKPTIPKPEENKRTKYDDLPAEERNKYFQEWDQMFESNEYLEMEDAAKWYGLDMSYLKKLLEQDLPEKYWLIPDAKAEFKRVQGELDRLAICLRSDTENALETAKKHVLDAKTWVDGTISETFVEDQRRILGDYRWPDYPSMIRFVSNKTNDWITKIQEAKTTFNDLIQEARSAIQTATKEGKDHSTLSSLIAITPSPTRNAIRLSNEIRKEIDKIVKSPMLDVADSCIKSKIDRVEVKKLQTDLDNDQIITRLAGGDMTKGSCSSLALAFAGNKAGLDVLDFRGGNSCSFFSRVGNIKAITTAAGGEIHKGYNDFAIAHEMYKSVKEGRLYYFTCGKHAAIIRKTATGFEFLELQSRYVNGFKDLNDAVLKSRFGAQKSHSFYGSKYEVEECLIDIELLKKSKGFQELLAYINTGNADQKKGASGNIK